MEEATASRHSNNERLRTTPSIAAVAFVLSGSKKTMVGNEVTAYCSPMPLFFK